MPKYSIISLVPTVHSAWHKLQLKHETPLPVKVFVSGNYSQSRVLKMVLRTNRKFEPVPDFERTEDGKLKKVSIIDSDCMGSLSKK